MDATHAADGPTTVWIPQSYAEHGQAFWAALPPWTDERGASVRAVGEATDDGRVWVAIPMAGLEADGTTHSIATDDGGAIELTLRVLPRGAGFGDLRRASTRKLEPANIVALVVLVAFLVYFLLDR